MVFRVAMPPELAGQPLHATDIPRDTGCTIIGIVRDGSCATAFDPAAALPVDAQLLLIGDDRAEERFFARYPSHPTVPGQRGWLRRLAERG